MKVCMPGDAQHVEEIVVNTSEIKVGTIQMVQNSLQFGGSPMEDPNQHILSFLEICATFKFNNVSEDAVKLRLFPFTLRDEAKSWLQSLPAGSITTWDDLAQKFLIKFLNMAKITSLWAALTQFQQQHGEILYEAWERYKEMLRKCPHHGIPDWLVINTFYNGLNGQTKLLIDSSSGGTILDKTYDQAYELIETMAMNEYRNSISRLPPQQKVAGILDVDTVTLLAAQMDSMNKKIDLLMSSIVQQSEEKAELEELRMMVKSQAASLKTLETQLGHYQAAARRSILD